jgi:hypothetical protein
MTRQAKNYNAKAHQNYCPAIKPGVRNAGACILIMFRWLDGRERERREGEIINKVGGRGLLRIEKSAGRFALERE